jgi:hypothetical protein
MALSDTVSLGFEGLGEQYESVVASHQARQDYNTSVKSTTWARF